LVALRKNYFAKKIYLYLYEKFLLRNALRVHLIGQSEADAMDDLGLKSNRILIPNGQDSENELENRHGSPDINFGFMGRFTVYTKGLDLLLKGFKLYRVQLRGFGKLQLIGSGGEIDKLKKMISKLQLNDSVVFMGAKYGDEKKTCLRALTAFFHPSRNEGLPGAVLEASALGIPCVVSKETNLLNYIKDYHAGIGLMDNAPEDIANAMKQLEACKISGKLPVMAKNAQRMVQSEFDWHLIARRFSKEVFTR